MSSWQDTKDAAKQAFTSAHYSDSLTLYLEAIDQLLAEDATSTTSNDENSSNHRKEHTNGHQILLSNVIACRLKIGGEGMAAKAIDEAKKVSTHELSLIYHMGDICLLLIAEGRSMDMNFE